jgi:2-polyprenyl-3-methyl-5-hydroxy-6-metoxy-1,4-benzoquinol methylase
MEMSLKNVQKNWHIFGKTKPFETLVIPPKGQEKWDVDAFFATGERQVEELIGYLESLGLELPGGAALDFGCGAGRVTQALAKHFDRCYGIDIAPSLITLAEQYNRCGEKCCYILNETADLQLFSDDCINFVYSYITLQGMAPRYAKMYLEEFIRILVVSLNN